MDKGLETVVALEDAYLLLLQAPHDGLRARNQATYAKVCAAIAAEWRTTSEEVQNLFESRVVEMKVAP